MILMRGTERFTRIAISLLSVTSIVLYFLETCRADDDFEFFEKSIRPILVDRCESCHSVTKGKTRGGLALDSQQGWQKGGDSGPTIVPGNVDESLLISAIRYRDDGPQMPPEEAGGRLADADVALLTEWVRRGAPDPRKVTPKRGGLTEQQIRDWWSFQPIRREDQSQSFRDGRNQSQSPIDGFIQKKLDAEGLTAFSDADRWTLIRRATYDLTGLPPTAEDVDTFLADSSATAFETLVERLLQSPHYGERWGRHWLDLVRYADTAGENSDHPIPDAWRYRNWVINSFNRDLPYDQFIREQVAGDLLHANNAADKYAEGVIGTGYLTIARRFGHDSDKSMYLTFEDTIDTLGKTFLGLSIACARCHDHKYDPISTNDYYALYGIFNSTSFAFPGCEAKQQPRDLVPLMPPAEWARTIEPYDRELAGIDAEVKQLTDALASYDGEFKSAASAIIETLARGEISDGGSQTFIDLPENPLKSVDVKIGQMIQLMIDPAGNYGADSTLIEWEVAEIDGDQRKWNLTQDVIADFISGNPHRDRLGNPAVWLFLDGRTGGSLLSESVRDLSGKSGLYAWRNGDNPAVFVNSTAQPINVWTSLPAMTLFVHPAPDGGVALGWVSSIEGKVKITGRVTDAHPGGPNGVRWQMDLCRGNFSNVVRQMAVTSTKRAQTMARRADLLARAPSREVAYAVTEGVAADAKLHLRGDPEKPGEVIPRRWLELFGGQSLPEGAGSGRLQLSQWLSDPSNPLTARVMVNRIWQYHFGKGLVQTPNDFGTRGQQPSHPDLLDWLATRFIDSGWSIKSMHRLIMNTAAYRRSSMNSSGTNPEKEIAIDPNNALIWRFDRRRLSAEELRDSLLVASQQIDLTPAGSHPIPPTGSWSYSQHVPFAGVPETNKRSLYLMTIRNRRNAFMGLFDGADPNATTPQRQVTTVPTQSLYFLNDAFFHTQAHTVARRILSQPDNKSKLVALFRIVFQRSPTDHECESAEAFLSNYTTVISDTSPSDQPLIVWSAYARILLASNEFLYLD